MPKVKQYSENMKKGIIPFCLAVLAVYGLRFEVTADGFALLNTQSFDWLLLFLFVFLLFRKIFAETDRKRFRCALGFGIVIGLCSFFGINYEKKESFLWILRSNRDILTALLLLLGKVILYTGAGYGLITLISSSKKSAGSVTEKTNRKRLFGVWFLLLLVYIPWYLYCYPGILTYDSGDQISWAINGIKTDFHPYILTLLIKGILRLCGLFNNSLQFGTGVLTFLQMLVMTFLFALTYERIARFSSSVWVRAAVLLWYLVYPVHILFSFTLWKDILFGGAVLLVTDQLALLLMDENAFRKNAIHSILLFIGLIAMPFTRHNGFYVLLILVPVLIRVSHGYRKMMCFIGCGAIAVYLIWKSICLPMMGVPKQNPADSLSVPLQQIGRTMRNHHEEMEAEELENITKWFKQAEFWETYSEILADPMKLAFDSAAYQSDQAAFWRVWAELGKKYPLDYLEAMLHNSYGYWFPETSYWITADGVIIHPPLSEEIKSEPMLRNVILDKLYNWYKYHKYRQFPVIALLFTPGSAFWVWCFCLFYAFYTDKRKLTVLLPGFLVWGTLIIGSPVYCEFRYIYCLFTSIPIVLVTVFSGMEKKNDLIEEE